MLVEIFYTETGTETFECEHCIGASAKLPYWVFWMPVQEDGKQKVRFVAKDKILEVALTGEPEGQDHLAEVVQFPGGEKNRPVPQN